MCCLLLGTESPIDWVATAFEQMAYIVSERAVYHVGDVGHEVGAGSFLVIPAGVVHYIEPLGTEPVMSMDFFLPTREDYMHLVKYLDEDK